jgi:phenylacetate-CoA ligase
MEIIKKSISLFRLGVLSNVLENLRKLEAWQWLDRDQLVNMQNMRLKRLLLHAYQHVPYYRGILSQAGVAKPNRDIDLRLYDQIPLLGKGLVRDRFEELKSDDLPRRKWYYNSSGGSTGEPVTLIQDTAYNSWTKASKMLFDRWSGYRLSDKKVRLWGSVRDLFNQSEQLKTRFMRWMKNDLWLNVFRMTPNEMRSHIEEINAFKPVQILAYAESIYELSRFIERENLQVHSPRAVMTSAGTLFPHMRKTIERVYKAPVFNRYGCREVGDIASECSLHSGLHIASPIYYLEVIKPDGTPAAPGQAGEIIITSLTNFAMPMIRYRIGDMGVRSESLCPCGRSWPLLKEITGRTTDVFVRQDGGIVSPQYLIHLVGVELNSGWIRKYQVIQEAHNRIRTLLVPTEPVEAPSIHFRKELGDITHAIQIAMGRSCRVKYDFVDDIAPNESGKYRYTISNITG